MTVADNVAYPLKIQGLKDRSGVQVAETCRPADRQPCRQAARSLVPPGIAGRAGAGDRHRAGSADPRRAARALRATEPRRGLGRDSPAASELGVTTCCSRASCPSARAADRLAVMDLGRILQVGPPQELYNNPTDVFVARFLGPTNLLQGQVDGTATKSGANRRAHATGRLVAQASGRVPPQGTPSPSRSAPRP